jgi:chemotaxis signal transduction protein
MRIGISSVLLMIVWLAYAISGSDLVLLLPSWVVQIIACLACLTRLERRRPNTRDLVIVIALYCCFLGRVHRQQTSPIGRFKNVYESIEVGMTVEEVSQIVDRRFPDIKPANDPDGTRVTLNLGPVDPFSNAELIQVTMTNEK